MSEFDIETTLKRVAEGALSVEEALPIFKQQTYEDLGYAKLDHNRRARQGAAEVVYGEGKTSEQLHGICSSLAKAQDCVLITRLSAEKAADLQSVFDLDYHKDSRIGIIGSLPKPDGNGSVVVAAAGTSDIPVAEEAALTAQALGNKVVRLYDVGVAGLHRLLSNLETLNDAQVVIAVAGMEGALPSVVSGLVSCPVIAVPTSVGYGASFGGLSALLSMLNSCASGVSVVNIDNGFGAGFQAHQINHLHIAGSSQTLEASSSDALSGESLHKGVSSARIYSVDNNQAPCTSADDSSKDKFLSALGSILRPVVAQGDAQSVPVNRSEADTEEFAVPGLDRTKPLPFLQKTVAFPAISEELLEQAAAKEADSGEDKPKEGSSPETSLKSEEASASEFDTKAKESKATKADIKEESKEDGAKPVEPREIMLDLSRSATRKSILEQLEALLDASQRKRRALILREARVPAKHHHDIAEVNQTIDNLNAPEELKEHMRAVYDILAHAEAKAHNVDVKETHFHEVGKGLSILNALNIAATFYVLEPSVVRASAVQTGKGTVKCEHGTMDIPAPATAAIIESGLPVVPESDLVEGEQCTPTSAALIKHFVQEFVTEG